MKIGITGFALLLGVTANAALGPHYYFQSMAPANFPTRDGLMTFDQKVNPADPSDARTFKQRYYIDATSAQGPTSPVLYYICGEANCFPDGVATAPYPPLVQYEAAQYHAYVVMLEHRYFGQSQPFDTMTTQNLQYLSIENAIEDLAAFQKYLMTTQSLTGKWIAMGGSYSGALAAFYRLVHPELVAGALASSAPVRAKESFDDYDQYVARGLPPDCLKATQDLNHKIEGVLNDANALGQIETAFGVTAAQVTDPRDVLGLVEFVSGASVQYGMESDYCTEVQSSDSVQGFAQFEQTVLGLFQLSPVQILPQGSASTQTSDYESSIGLRQWNYITCAELGDFSTPYPDPSQSAESSLLDLKYNEGVCQRLFSDGQTPAQAHGPLTDAINQRYYSRILDPSTTNIFFTNGEKDPWSSLSISHVLGNDTNPNLMTYLISGGAHCDDLGNTPDGASDAIKGAIDQFTSLLATWTK
jgi:hypothetical protein